MGTKKKRKSRQKYYSFKPSTQKTPERTCVERVYVLIYPGPALQLFRKVQEVFDAKAAHAVAEQHHGRIAAGT
jgi:hypothetical protein